MAINGDCGCQVMLISMKCDRNSRDYNKGQFHPSGRPNHTWLRTSSAFDESTAFNYEFGGRINVATTIEPVAEEQP